MRQQVVQDQVAVRYADGIDHVWNAWEPALRRCEMLLGGTSWRSGIEPQELADHLRRAQYRAHTAGEFATGLVPPPSAADAHSMLLTSLGICRDTLGVLAVRAELDELDEDISVIGLHAVDSTRDAFRSARSTTVLVHAWVADDEVGPSWLPGESPAGPSRAASIVLWALVVTCVVLLGALLVEVFLISPHP